MSQKLLKLGEVAAVLRCSLPTVYRQINDGRLATVRVGRVLRVTEGDLQKYLDDSREGGKA